jgi:hypothetical protein
VQRAIDRGYLVEAADPDDRRARTVAIAPAMRERIERFIDRSITAFERAQGGAAPPARTSGTRS